ncbi:hypothetical protein KIN20_025497 [Parelaphostrongylus tenuis]|uniref:Uncharacterized protein n=1 Tax=Parelaphostrongylus tenuis TaxID=148309 RepID=A0AAD5MZJ6_PARTN|nr:hypothetical protein KIN20_025497 [Parelaphostrongylus tenuis]
MGVGAIIGGGRRPERAAAAQFDQSVIATQIETRSVPRQARVTNKGYLTEYLGSTRAVAEQGARTGLRSRNHKMTSEGYVAATCTNEFHHRGGDQFDWGTIAEWMGGLRDGFSSRALGFDA